MHDKYLCPGVISLLARNERIGLSFRGNHVRGVPLSTFSRDGQILAPTEAEAVRQLFDGGYLTRAGNEYTFNMGR